MSESTGLMEVTDIENVIVVNMDSNFGILSLHFNTYQKKAVLQNNIVSLIK